jgi:hypothetical protein
MTADSFYRRHKAEIWLSLAFALSSAALYGLQVLVFQSPRDSAFYFLQDLSFVPIQTILVTVVLSELLTGQEKRSAVNRMNIAVGIFFSEMGTELTKLCGAFDREPEKLAEQLLVTGHWSARDFAQARKDVLGRKLEIRASDSDLRVLQGFLSEKRPILLAPLENPNLLEHAELTDMLWAVSHLS